MAFCVPNRIVIREKRRLFVYRSYPQPAGLLWSGVTAFKGPRGGLLGTETRLSVYRATAYWVPNSGYLGTEGERVNA